MCQHDHAHPPAPAAPPPRRAVALEDGAAHDRDHRAWSRRDFLVRAGLAGAVGPFLLPSAPVRATGVSPLLARLAALETDRVLVLIQLSGGNDGLNTVVPITNDLYYTARPTVRIASGSALALSADYGMHPSLAGVQGLWGAGQMAVVHAVGYASPNLSHFRSTDIWVTGSDANVVLDSGWGGRAMAAQYPDFVTSPPAAPPAVQIGTSVPTLFRASGQSYGMTMLDTATLERIAADGAVFDPAAVPPTPSGAEVGFLRTVANDTYRYVETVRAAANAGSNAVTYPATNLGRDLAAAARLIKGQLDTRIFLVNLGGFDTHAGQLASHANLMATLAGAVQAFYADLAADAARVLTLTFSEFGRRVRENGSGGTDHGTAAPLFVFGGGVAGGLYGTGPDLASLDSSGNLRHTTEFRQVYAGALGDWFGLDGATVASVLGGTFEPVPFVSALATPVQPAAAPAPFALEGAHPNPFDDYAEVAFTLGREGPVRLDVFDVTGRRVAVLADGAYPAGRHRARFEAVGLAAGVYIVRLQSAEGTRTTRLTRVR